MDERWIWAAVAVACGLLLGAAVGMLIRRRLDRPSRRAGLREVAGPLSLFAFWLLVATGIVVAVGVANPERLEPIPADLLEWMPNLAIAGLLVIGGYGLGLTIATAVGRAISGVSGERNRSLERGIRAVVLAAATILALSQLGVDTTIIDILIAGGAATAALTIAGLSVLGGRDVAANVAMGRTLIGTIGVGDRITSGEISGVVDQVTPAHLIVATVDGRLVVPFGLLADRPILVVEPEPTEERGNATGYRS